MKKKILFFLPSGTGGAERMTITIAKMLPLDSFDVKFVIVHRSLGTIINFIPKGYEIMQIPIHNIYCAGTLRLCKMIWKEKPDIVFGSLLYLNARLIIAAKLCGCKVVVRNNIGLSKVTSKINPFLVKLTYKWADKVIAQQEEMHDEILQYTKISTDKIVTLHNPLDIEYIELKSKEPSPYKDKGLQIKYVWVGRFNYVKGQDLLVKAFKHVVEKKQNAHLYLIGSYDPNSIFFKDIMNYIKDNHLEEHVHIMGFDSNPYRWVKYCDCYVMPSRLEGLPNSLIDAMYLKRPVVATKCIPIIERIVDDGYNGCLVETENIDGIAKGMVKALQLKDFKMTYKPASSDMFVSLFKNL